MGSVCFCVGETELREQKSPPLVRPKRVQMGQWHDSGEDLGLEILKSGGAGTGARRWGSLEGPCRPCPGLEGGALEAVGAALIWGGGLSPYMLVGLPSQKTSGWVPGLLSCSLLPKNPLGWLQDNPPSPFPSSRTLRECPGEVLQGCFTEEEH